MDFPGGSAVKSSPAMQETRVQSLGGEDPLEEGMATHSNILACRIPMDRGAWWATVRGVAKRQTRLSDAAQHKLQRKQKQNPLTDPGICSVCASLVFFIF